MKDGYVSLIVPCYNAQKTVRRFLNSVLNQTYSEIQLIVVNDGSTDDTEKILKEYAKKMETTKIEFIYIYQENAGLGEAINTGLKNVNGEYLAWADPDDFFFKESIKKRVEFLKKNKEYGIISSDAYYFMADNLEIPIGKASDGLPDCNDSRQFEHLIKEKSIFCSGCHLIRMSAFDDVNPQHKIYPARRGQNWQLLLPVYYKYKRYYMDEALYGYVIYSNSMSRGDTSEDKVLQRWNEHENILLETINNIHMSEVEKEKYVHIIKKRYAEKRFYTAIDYKDKKRLKEEYEYIKELKGETKALRDLYMRNEYRICKIFYKVKDYIKQ